ncbi:hypothetical protein H2204_012305 [Knufia peltigerae]|uniref:laccase n=1 Tax=Knufia peltigerae TaxID=1002370 RepID=A0AA38XSX1_9EURO|nr:hypothetical protein H2204_012305 [Knufia peltigerae]
MRSLKYLAALLPLHSLGVFANGPEEGDVIVEVTTTRTITVCPLTEFFTCEADTLPTKLPWEDWTTTPGSAATTTTTTAGGEGPSSTIVTSSGSWGSSTTSGTWSWSTTGVPTGSTTSAPHYGNSSSTSYTSGVTSSSSSSATLTTTTSSACQNGTASTATGLPEPRCNGPDDRSHWCVGKSVDDDTHKTFYTGQTKKYTLTITEEQLDYDGTLKHSFAINGQSPGEAIVANWGDMVEVTVVNGLTTNATTIHWHGIRQTGTNDQDGVPGVSECGIAPGAARVYKWHASTYGTGWYHSHALSQYGAGCRGPIIIHGPATANYDLDMGSVMIDEAFNQTIFQMAYNIARVRGALPPATNYLLNGKNKSPDGTKGESAQWTVKKGKKHLFRIINSSAQSSYIVHFDHHKMKVVSADFTPIVPYETDVLHIQSGQRYNVIVEMDQPEGAYFLRAVTQTGCGIRSLNDGLGTSNGVFTYEGSCGAPKADNFTITATDCLDEPLGKLIPHDSKNAGSVSEFQDSVKLLPGGNAGSQDFGEYGPVVRWYLGGLKDLSENSGAPAANKAINVTYSEPTLKTLATLPNLGYNSSYFGNSAVLDGPANAWVYFVIQNNFQTSHPMHLHGHDFSVLGQGKGVFTSDMVGQLNFQNPVRRDTTLLFGAGSPQSFVSGWTVIGFETDNPGAWIMHCHIIWHADGGMGLQFLERPGEIDAKGYYDGDFKDECASYGTYEASAPHRHPYESGLKARHLQNHRMSHRNVVRKH